MRTRPAEMRTFTDRSTGVAVTQLTDHLGHSNHLYFTNPGWWDGGRQLLFQSDRDNAGNLFSVRLADGLITQITDEAQPVDFQGTCVNPARDEACFWRGSDLIAVDLRNGAQRTVHRAPDGWTPGNTSINADGRYVCTALRQRVDFERDLDLGHGYVGFRELFEARPLCQVVRIGVDDGAAQVLHEERSWIGHVNASPTRANLLTFCHEGPWHRVRQRMWALDTDGAGGPWKLRPQAGHEAMGHEYWMSDGERVGYHGWLDEARRNTVFGSVRFDDTDRVERSFPYNSHHFHSNDATLIVGDGPQEGLSPHVVLWRLEGDRYVGPRVLCTHRASRNIQRTHVHPRFTPDGRGVLFTSDATGYANVYLAEVPPFEALPEAGA